MLQRLLKKYPNANWNYELLSYNPNLTLQDVLERHRENWDWFGISRSANITEADIEMNLPWNYRGLSKNPNISMEYIINRYKDWDWESLSISRHINQIREYPNLPWNWKIIQWNKTLTLEFISENIDKPWDFEELSRHKCITLEFVKIHTNKPWDFDFIKKNKEDKKNKEEYKTVKEIIEQNIYSDFDSLNDILAIIKHFKETKWDWKIISRRVSFSTIIENPELPWDWNIISKYQQIPMSFMNDDRINFSFLSSNPFYYHSHEKPLKQKLKKNKESLNILKMPKHLVEYIKNPL